MKIFLTYDSICKVKKIKGALDLWKLFIGTTNNGKKNQVQEFLRYNNYDVELITLKDIGFDEEIEESRKYF